MQVDYLKTTTEEVFEIPSSILKTANIVCITQEPIFEEAPFPSCHASTIIEIEAGCFMAAWFGGTKEKAKDVGIWTSIYRNGAWSSPVEVVKHDDIQPCWNPVLFKMPSKTLCAGEILLFYKYGPHPSEWSGYLKRSIDGGNTWQEAKPLLLSSGDSAIGPVKNKPLLLDDGSIIAGSSIENVKPNFCYFERSMDGGLTWTRSDPIGPLHVQGNTYGIIQPTLLQTRDGLVMLGRTRDKLGHAWYSKSTNQGKTWSPAEMLDLPVPDSGVDAVTLQNGTHLLLYNHGSSRKRLDAAISEDGKHWDSILNLEESTDPTPGIEYSYPAVIQAEDGRVHITYTKNRTQIIHVVIEVR